MVGNAFNLLLFILANSIIWIEAITGEHNITINFSPNEVKLTEEESKNVSILFSRGLSSPATIVFMYQQGNDHATYNQSHVVIAPLDDLILSANTTQATVSFLGQAVGSVFVEINSSSMEFENLSDTYAQVTVVHSLPLVMVIAVIGWIYFVAWSISFYPQIIYNFRRKSVVGLNFDFLAYNLTGFIAYSLFNIGMYWVPEVKAEYHEKYPRGVNPVQLNDVIFAVHAVFITIVTICQCFLYERGGQKVSRICTILLSGAWLFILVTVFLAVGKVITWLDFLYYFSYVKLGVTLIKYIPQALMNYRRKSTEGWSIGNVLLDFTGGSFSLLQMFLLSYNNNDWSSILGDPTKFGLGLFSILFDIVFIIQHYGLYRHNGSGYQPINSDSETDTKEA